MTAGQETGGLSAEDVRGLADFIAEERDRYPRRADDMDSEELAANIADWLATRAAQPDANTALDEVERRIEEQAEHRHEHVTLCHVADLRIVREVRAALTPPEDQPPDC